MHLLVPDIANTANKLIIIFFVNACTCLILMDFVLIYIVNCIIPFLYIKKNHRKLKED